MLLAMFHLMIVIRSAVFCCVISTNLSRPVSERNVASRTVREQKIGVGAFRSSELRQACSRPQRRTDQQDAEIRATIRDSRSPIVL